MTDRFDAGGSRTQVLAALDADLLLVTTGPLVATKTFVRAQIAACDEQQMGCVIRLLDNNDEEGGWTIAASWSIFPLTVP